MGEAGMRSAGERRGATLFRHTLEKTTTTSKLPRKTAATSSGEDAIRSILRRAILLRARYKLLETGGPTPYPLRRGELAGAGREGAGAMWIWGALAEASRGRKPRTSGWGSWDVTCSVYRGTKITSLPSMKTTTTGVLRRWR